MTDVGAQVRAELTRTHELYERAKSDRDRWLKRMVKLERRQEIIKAICGDSYNFDAKLDGLLNAVKELEVYWAANSMVMLPEDSDELAEFDFIVMRLRRAMSDFVKGQI